MMPHLLLIRHGRSTGNARHVFQGIADLPLDEVGKEQARRLARRLEESPPAALYASPLERAHETARIISTALDIPVTTDDRLKEYDVGEVTGLTWPEMEARYPDVAQRWSRGEEPGIPGSEDHRAFRRRIATAIDEILAQHREEQGIGIVAHGGTLGMYLNHLLGIQSWQFPFTFGNASLTIVQVNPTRPRILLLNDTCHLRGMV